MIKIKKDILILEKGPIDGLDDATITSEAEYSINFTEQENKFCLSLYYNESNNFLYVNGGKNYQFQAKGFEIVAYPLCLENISKDFTNHNMETAGLNGFLCDLIGSCATEPIILLMIYLQTYMFQIKQNMKWINR